MLVYHEKSMMVSVNPDLSVRAIEQRLKPLNRTLGYCPIDGDTVSLNDCMHRRLPNRYFLLYGDIAELCLGWKARMPRGGTWNISPYPRAAMGPDCRRFLIGAGDRTPAFSTCTFKVFPLPSDEILLLYAFSEKTDVNALLYWMLDHFIRPLAVWTGPIAHLSLKKKETVAPEKTHALLMSFVGRRDTLSQKLIHLRQYLDLRKAEEIPIAHSADHQLLHSIVHGAHPLGKDVVTRLVPSIANAGGARDLSRNWLMSEWHKLKLGQKTEQGEGVC